MNGVQVMWYLNGKAISFGQDSPFERASADSSVLTTKGKVDKRAHGVYSCQAENEVRVNQKNNEHLSHASWL